MEATMSRTRTVNLEASPYFLNKEQIQWVEDTLSKMDLETRIRHLFAPHGPQPDPAFLAQWVKEYKPGAVMFRPMPKKLIHEVHTVLQENSEIPLLLAANLEEGGNGLAEEGTYYGKQLQVAATDDEQYAYRLGDIAGKEAAAVGGNWAFAPIIDIDNNWRNPITNVRSYGDDPERVLRMAKQYKKAFESHGGAVAIKHFPGDGVDERDHHLHVTFNTLPLEEWRATYGKVYRGMIEEGAHTVMVGHIALPAYSRSKGVPDSELKSATLSPELLQDLLRDELGFNGMVITDATPMIGFASSASREEAVPKAVASGCDMILFNRSYDEDINYMRKGIEKGILTEERVEDAVRRILGVKASLSLHEKEQLVPGAEDLEVIGCEEHKKQASELADQSITLVRDREEILPINAETHKRIYLMPLGVTVEDSRIIRMKAQLEQQGFNVDLQDVRTFGFDKASLSLQELKDKYDLALYVAVEETKSNRTVVRLNFSPLLSFDAPWFSHEVPSIVVSLANPYHLIDVPFVSTYINAYSANEASVDSVVDKLMGKSPFKGISPVDPYCGNRFDLHLYD